MFVEPEAQVRILRVPRLTVAQKDTKDALAVHSSSASLHLRKQRVLTSVQVRAYIKSLLHLTSPTSSVRAFIKFLQFSQLPSVAIPLLGTTKDKAQ